MTARSRTVCQQLRVELLEGRLLPSGTGTIDLTAMASGVAGQFVPLVPTTASRDARLGDSASASARDARGVEIDDAADAVRALSTAVGLLPQAPSNLVRVPPLDLGGAGNLLGSAERDLLAHGFDSLVRLIEEVREERIRERPEIELPVAPPTALSVSGTRGHTARSDASDGAPGTGTPNTTRSAAEAQGIAVSLPASSQPALDVGTAPPNPSNYQPPTDKPEGATLELIPATPLDPVPPSWRDVFGHPFVGTPIAEALPIDLSTLDDATQALFEHLTDLSSEWSTELDWSDYMWVAAGVLLAGGGVHFARGLRARRATNLGRPIAEI